MDTLIKAHNIYKSFKADDHQRHFVLENVNLSLQENEIIALLGKSGSGKSTLLRILAGLIVPTAGEVIYRGQPISEPVPGISMVFQHFALLPWLTVMQNVELGLEAQGVAADQCRERALQAIDIIGLDGFESAYPRELSGGMCQRVGFARALVVNPDLLIMDEPFSALDVLTSENLKSDLLDVWQQKKTNLSGMLLVTHNIEEAAMLADRILIFGSNPGYVRADIAVDMPHPRHSQSPAFSRVVDKIYTLMTTSSDQRWKLRTLETQPVAIGYRLPQVSPAELTGLIETLHHDFEHQDSVDLPELADHLTMDIDNLFPITESLELLGFAKISKGDIQLSAVGKAFASADLLERKQQFYRQLLSRVQLAQEIRRLLDEAPEHGISRRVILQQLQLELREQEAQRVLAVVIEWGRYAELFAYDSDTRHLSLENP